MARPHRKAGPWYGRDQERLEFEKGTRSYTNLRGKTKKRVGRTYTARVTVRFYETRKVKILFPSGRSKSPTITVDGPTDSPHRYEDGRLCIWYSDDDSSARWEHGDGLLDLLGLIEAHLFREAWWRETAEWLGPEIQHDSPKDDEEYDAA
jgi:hypothetical protein